MATLGITYFLEGSGQALFGNDIYKIDVGMPKDPIFLFEKTFQGGMLVNKEDLYAAVIAAVLVAAAGALLPEDGHRARAARGRRRPPGGAVDRHPARPDLGHRLVGRRHRRARRRRHLGLQARRPVLALAGRAEGAAGRHPRRPDVDPGRDHRRPDHRRRREALRDLHRAEARRRHRDLVRLRARPRLPAGPAAGAVRREDHRPRLSRTDMLYRENGQFKTSYRADQQIFPILQDRIAIGAAAGRRLRRGAAARLRVPDARDPDPVPDPLARRARPQHPGRLLRPDLARHRRLHGGRRLRGLQLHGAHRRHAAGRRAAARRR